MDLTQQWLHLNYDCRVAVTGGLTLTGRGRQELKKHPWWPISPPAKREHFPLDILCVYTRFSKISSHRQHSRTFPFSVCLLSPAFSITPFSTKIICPLAGSLSFVFSTLAPRGCVWLTQGQLSSFQARWIAAGCRGNKQPTNFFCLYFLFIYFFPFNRTRMKGAYKMRSGRSEEW